MIRRLDHLAKHHPSLNGPSEPPPMHELKNISHPLGLTNPDHAARYNCLNECMIVATRYYDEELLAHLGLLDDIR